MRWMGGLLGVVAAFASSAWPAQAAELRVALSPAGELSVVGTPTDDWVRFTRSGAAYEVTSDRAPAMRVGGGCRRSARKVAVCPLAGVRRITVVTREGLDRVLVGSVEPFTIPITISTGGGHDYVDLGFEVAGPVTVDAAAGDDYVVGGAGPDRLDGGDGDDQLAGLSGADTLLGGAGDDFLEDMLAGPTPEADYLTAGRESTSRGRMSGQTSCWPASSRRASGPCGSRRRGSSIASGGSATGRPCSPGSG